jgi:hypothetical protein
MRASRAEPFGGQTGSGAIEDGRRRPPDACEERQLVRISLSSERRKALDEALRQMLASFPATWEVRVVLGEKTRLALSRRDPSGPHAACH